MSRLAELVLHAGELESARVCRRCRRLLPVTAYAVRDRRARGRIRITRWCGSCRDRYKHERDERRRAGENPRARETNARARARAPRDLGTNPRALGTNPHAGKSESTGQWAAAFRRLNRLTPERLHELERELESALRRYGPSPELAELERRLAGALLHRS